jgi:hypothetical protein
MVKSSPAAGILGVMDRGRYGSEHQMQNRKKVELRTGWQAHVGVGFDHRVDVL